MEMETEIETEMEMQMRGGVSGEKSTLGNCAHGRL